MVSIRVDATGAQTRLDMRQSLDAVQVAQLLTDLADVEQLEGLVVAKLDLTGAGKTDADLRNTLAGKVSFQLADGVYKGLDIWHEIRKARATFRGEAPPARTGPAQTEITALDFAGQLVDGTLNTERMVAQLPFLRVTGDGALNLADESLNYSFNARVLQIPEFPDGERLKGPGRLEHSVAADRDAREPEARGGPRRVREDPRRAGDSRQAVRQARPGEKAGAGPRARAGQRTGRGNLG